MKVLIHVSISQVKFLAGSSVVAVQTQGHPNGDHVTSFRLEYSGDCVSFQGLVDAYAENEVCCVNLAEVILMILQYTHFQGGYSDSRLKYYTRFCHTSNEYLVMLFYLLILSV